MEDTNGTTLEILAPYLPYGIEVFWRTTERGKALNYATTLKGYLPGSDFALQRNGDIQRWAAAEELTPVLRPFLALCNPLPDGTVPAVEVAKIILNCQHPFGRTIDFPTDAARMRRNMAEITFWLVSREGNNIANGAVTISDEFDIHVGCGDDMARYGNYNAAYKYLRRHHFAVGLKPHQFITKS